MDRLVEVYFLLVTDDNSRSELGRNSSLGFDGAVATVAAASAAGGEVPGSPSHIERVKHRVRVLQKS